MAHFSLLGDFRWLMLSATVATAAAAFFIPTFQRVFSGAVLDFQEHRSLPRLLLRAFSMLQPLPRWTKR